MKIVVLDSEGDGLAYDCTKLHVLSYTYDGKAYHSTGAYEEMRELLTQEDTKFVAHNAVRHDMVAFHRILGIPMDYTKWIDTLALSWFLFPERKKHGLGSWAKEMGGSKPEVEDWEGLTYEQYKYRCEEDCKVNWNLWKHFSNRLDEIYG